MKIYMSFSRTGPERIASNAIRREQEAIRYIRLLFSYAYFKNDDLDYHAREYFSHVERDFFADSGAYTAWTLGETITVEEYAAWLAKWKHLFTCAAALDVIGNAEASFAQTVRLRELLAGEEGVPEILPVYHSNDVGGTIWLRRYLDAGYKYIGISPTGAIYSNRKLLTAWLDACFKMKPPDVRYHGFGVTGWSMVSQFPWYSVDSSSWTMGFRFAQLELFDERRGRPVKIKMRDGRDLLRNSGLLESYGLRPTHARADEYDRVQIGAAIIRSWQRMEAHLSRRIHASQEAAHSRDPRDGTRVYMVTGPVSNASPQAIAVPNKARPMRRVRGEK